MAEEPKEKRQINIVISDVDNIDIVLEALYKLFDNIITHYSATTNLAYIKKLILGGAMYFGLLIKTLGLTEDDLLNEQD